jgi:small subunit ribosomal protein S16
MAVKLRLARTGTHKRPHFWIVATDSRNPRDGRYLEKLGTYDPKSEPRTSALKIERIHHWLDKGATPTDVVRELLRDQGILKARVKKAEQPAEPAGA